jgi:hypothetical protein
MRPLSRLALLPMLAMFVAGVAGCASDSTAPSSPTLTDVEANRIGVHLAGELTASMSIVGAGGNAAAIASTRGAPARIAAAFSRVSGRSESSTELTPACPTLDNTIDTDGDGVPDDATATFALPQCRAIVANDTTEITGTVHVTDPVVSPPPNPQAFGFTAVLSNFTVRFGSADLSASFTETRNGGEGLVFAPAGLQQAHHMSIVRQDSGGTTLVTEQLQAAFAPAQGFALIPGHALPNGDFVASGASSWQHGSTGAEMEIATIVPLAYDASCAAGAPTPFRAGEVRARAVNPGAEAVVRIVFANCQAPTITLLAHN